MQSTPSPCSSLAVEVIWPSQVVWFTRKWEGNPSLPTYTSYDDRHVARVSGKQLMVREQLIQEAGYLNLHNYLGPLNSLG